MVQVLSFVFNNIFKFNLQRIANITSTLQYSLEGLFREGLDNGQVDVLRQCLRTYATIDKMRDAENLFRQHVVKPYVEEVSLSSSSLIYDIVHCLVYRMLDAVCACIPDRINVTVRFKIYPMVFKIDVGNLESRQFGCAVYPGF